MPTFSASSSSNTDPAAGQPVERPVEHGYDGGKTAVQPAKTVGRTDASTLRRVAAEALWTELAEAFQKGSDEPTNAVVEGTDWASFGLSQDEISFYKNLRSLMNRNGQDFSGDDWLRRFRNAGYIYDEIEAIFEKNAPGSAARPEKVWGNPATLGQVTEAVRAEFGIEADKTDGFLRKYPQAGVGKWATLVFYLQN